MLIALQIVDKKQKTNCFFQSFALVYQQQGQGFRNFNSKIKIPKKNKIIGSKNFIFLACSETQTG